MKRNQILTAVLLALLFTIGFAACACAAEIRPIPVDHDSLDQGNGEFPFQTGDIPGGILLTGLNAGCWNADTGADIDLGGAQLTVAGMQVTDMEPFQHQLGRLEPAGAAHGNLGIAGGTDIKIRSGFAAEPFRVQVAAAAQVMDIAENSADQDAWTDLFPDPFEEVCGTFGRQGIAVFPPLNQMFRQNRGAVIPVVFALFRDGQGDLAVTGTPFSIIFHPARRGKIQVEVKPFLRPAASHIIRHDPVCIIFFQSAIA